MLVKEAVRAGADCKVNPVASLDHVKTIFAPEGKMDNCGGATGNERLNTVPLPELPPHCAVPYRVLTDKINPAVGSAPSLSPVKLYRFVKPVPSVPTANTVPLPELPP